MSTALAGDGRFKPGDHVEMNKFVINGDPERIEVVVVEPLTGGFYQVETPTGQQMLMHDPDDKPVKLGVEDTQSIPVVKPKVELNRTPARIPEQPPFKAPGTKDPVEFGMSSPDLAVEVANVVSALTDRVLGPGKEQYEQLDPNGVLYQNFETMDLPTLILMALEEIDDQIVYLVMFHIRLRRLQAALKAKLPPTES